ncbi:MAG: chromate transporter, partial [Treponema sp.]|nr:chromate transporter [Treponema sp.]
LLSQAMRSLKDNRIAASVFSGLRPAAAGLLSAAGFGVWKLALYDAAGTAWFEIIRWRESLVVIALFLLLIRFGWHPVIYIALGAIAGIVLGL